MVPQTKCSPLLLYFTIPLLYFQRVWCLLKHFRGQRLLLPSFATLIPTVFLSASTETHTNSENKQFSFFSPGTSQPTTILTFPRLPVFSFCQPAKNQGEIFEPLNVSGIFLLFLSFSHRLICFDMNGKFRTHRQTEANWFA